MSYEVKWQMDDAVILVKLAGDMDIQDFPKFDRLILKHLDESQRPLVHLWVDLKDVTQFPANVLQVNKALTHKTHKRLGWTLLITDNRVIRFVGYMITQIAKARFRAFTTEEEARSFLYQVDPELTPTVASR